MGRKQEEAWMQHCPGGRETLDSALVCTGPGMEPALLTLLCGRPRSLVGCATPRQPQLGRNSRLARAEGIAPTAGFGTTHWT